MAIKRGPFESILGRPTQKKRGGRTLIMPSKKKSTAARARSSSSFGVTGQPIRPAGTGPAAGNVGAQRRRYDMLVAQREDKRRFDKMMAARSRESSKVAGARPLSETWGRSTVTTPTIPRLPQEAISGMESLASSYNQAYGQARQANEQRYQQMLDISRQETQRRQGVFQGMLGVAGETTQQRATDIRAEGATRESDVMQQLARQGMGGTTVAPTMREGVRAGTQASLNRLADTMQGTRLGIMSQQAAPQRGTELGIMERRTDAYPDLGVLTGAFGAVGEGFGGPGMTAMLKSLSQIRQG